MYFIKPYNATCTSGHKDGQKYLQIRVLEPFRFFLGARQKSTRVIMCPVCSLIHIKFYAAVIGVHWTLYKSGLCCTHYDLAAAVGSLSSNLNFSIWTTTWSPMMHCSSHKCLRNEVMPPDNKGLKH